MKFLTDEWTAEFEKRAKDIFAEGKSPTQLTVKLVECYENVPQLDGRDFWHMYSMEDGVIEELSHGYDKADIPADADFVTYCPYSIVKQIMSGEVSTPRPCCPGR